MQKYAAMVLSTDVTADDIRRMSDELPGWQIERIAGKIVMSPPAGFGTSVRNIELAGLLLAYAHEHGYVAFDSSAGLTMPNDDILSPDGGLVRAERVGALSPADREAFAHIVPDVVVEIVSPRDRGRTAPREKCELWFDQGVEYVVLLDPFEKKMSTWGVAPAQFPDLGAILDL